MRVGGYTPPVPVSAPDLLAPDGPIARRMAEAAGAAGHSFEARPQQRAMAAAVAAALASPRPEPDDDADASAAPGARLLIEAGTGVGKSFAYLVPAMLRCILHRERIIIATNTIALQEQLIAKDIPFLLETLPEWGLPATDERGESYPPLKPVLVKGRGNYLSIRRLKLATQRESTLFPDDRARATLHAIEEWAYSTSDGTLSTAPVLERPAVWDRVQSDSANCMGRRCPTYGRCFYQNARREMEGGNLLICNHALFFSDLALRAATDGEAGFLPDYDHVILDEAHNVEDVASEHFGLSLTESRVSHLLSMLYSHRGRGVGRGYLSGVRLKPEFGTDAIDAACRAVLEAESASRAFFDGLIALLRSGRLPGGRLAPEHVAELANPLTPALKSLALRLKSIREGVEDEQDGFELASYIARAEAIADTAAALTAQTVPGSVYWIEVSDADAELMAQTGAGRRGARPSPPKVRLACSPVEVAPLLREHLFSKPHSIILTSATLATRTVDAGEPTERAETAFAHTMSRLGIDPDGVRTMQLDSPFDYANQVRVYVDVTMPDPRPSRPQPRARQQWGGWGDEEGGADPYIEALTSRILDHVRATEGGAFVLFTSFATLYACADALERPLENLGMPLLVQGRGGSRSQILEAFRRDERSVLLGAASFWQGVDVRGRALRNVIITRLPFDPPDRPLTQARLDRIKARGGNPFMEDSLPRAIIRFKQGFGRLIRSRGDTGRVVVLDPRLVTARYGRLFIDALPAGVDVEVIED